MRRQRIVAWGQPLEARECSTPTPEGAQVLLRVEAAGVRHSDVRIRAGYFDLGDGERSRLQDRGASQPLTLGRRLRGSCVGAPPEMRAPMELARAGKAPPIPTAPRPLAEAGAALDGPEGGRVVGRYAPQP